MSTQKRIEYLYFKMYKKGNVSACRVLRRFIDRVTVVTIETFALLQAKNRNLWEQLDNEEAVND